VIDASFDKIYLRQALRLSRFLHGNPLAPSPRQHRNSLGGQNGFLEPRNNPAHRQCYCEGSVLSFRRFHLPRTCRKRGGKHQSATVNQKKTRRNTSRRDHRSPRVLPCRDRLQRSIGQNCSPSLGDRRKNVGADPRAWKESGDHPGIRKYQHRIFWVDHSTSDAGEQIFTAMDLPHDIGL
jgi:hypothetical protein